MGSWSSKHYRMPSKFNEIQRKATWLMNCLVDFCWISLNLIAFTGLLETFKKIQKAYRRQFLVAFHWNSSSKIFTWELASSLEIYNDWILRPMLVLKLVYKHVVRSQYFLNRTFPGFLFIGYPLLGKLSICRWAHHRGCVQFFCKYIEKNVSTIDPCKWPWCPRAYLRLPCDLSASSSRNWVAEELMECKKKQFWCWKWFMGQRNVW